MPASLPFLSTMAVAPGRPGVLVITATARNSGSPSPTTGFASPVRISSPTRITRRPSEPPGW